MPNQEKQISYEQYLTALDTVLKYQSQILSAHQSVEENNLLEKNITSIYFSRKVFNAFVELNIFKVKDILKFSEQDFKALPNFGVTSIHEIKESLATMGLKLEKK